MGRIGRIADPTRRIGRIVRSYRSYDPKNRICPPALIAIAPPLCVSNTPDNPPPGSDDSPLLRRRRLLLLLRLSPLLLLLRRLLLLLRLFPSSSCCGVFSSSGCSGLLFFTIMSGGWTDRRRRTLINFLVNNSKGTIFLKSIDASNIIKSAENIFKMIDDIVEEVGEDAVVQVVTDNAANYKAVGAMLMEKRKRLYWTPCATHCIDLMFEDLKKKIKVHHDTIPKAKKITTFIYSRTSLISMLKIFTKDKDLVRPTMTRFATSYLTLGCLHENKLALIRMFNYEKWKASRCSSSSEGKAIEDVVIDKTFWKNIVICLKGAYPLMKVLRIVDSDEKPAMGFIYEEMDQAKERIAHAFHGVQKL